MHSWNSGITGESIESNKKTIENVYNMAYEKNTATIREIREVIHIFVILVSSVDSINVSFVKNVPYNALFYLYYFG